MEQPNTNNRTKISCYDQIPYYYIDTGVFGQIFASSKFRDLGNEVFNTETFLLHSRRDVLIENTEDFMFAIRCCDYWLVKKIPEHIIKFLDIVKENIPDIMKVVRESLPRYEEQFTKIILKILNFQKEIFCTSQAVYWDSDEFREY